MTAQFQYTRLAHQAQAVQSIADVFADVGFTPALGSEANPVFHPAAAAQVLQANIAQVREANHITQGEVQVATTATPSLTLDVLMETGTGKTFTFIETMHKLHQQYKLSKFIVLVPSNAIRQGTLKSLQTTAAFFAKEYNNQKINVFNYSSKTVRGFVHSANAGISVMVATYQSFNKDKNTINQRGVEANLFGRAKSYMEALGAIRPVIIIDEPHRFEGAKTQAYLAKFNPLFTLRFGATFKGEYSNLIYTLDSLDAFRQRLVKGITVDTVGVGSADTCALCLTQVTGSAGARVAQVSYQTLRGAQAQVALQVRDNLGEKTGIAYLGAYVVESIATKEVVFTNGFALPLGEPTSYGMLAEEIQQAIVGRSIANHFEREEMLFKRGIKALSLFFIDAVAKYLPEGNKPAVLRDVFEQAYTAQLQQVLAKPDLDAGYRTYLERSAADVTQVHKGYFARSHNEKGEEEAIKLILEEKEKLLSFDTDLRFIFSMWALQEGWDNPNIFTLCKLAPSHSRITKLQQIGRGLRLAVNQNLERMSPDDAAFDEVNELVVVVPATEGDFVAAIQSEISAHSVRRVGKTFDDGVLAEFGVAPSTRVANRVLDALQALGVIDLHDVTGQATLLLDRATYLARRDEILARLKTIVGIEEVNAVNMQTYLDAYYDSYGKVKHKAEKPKATLRVSATQYQKFKALWEGLNRNAVVRYELNEAALVAKILGNIESSFDVRPLALSVSRTTGVEALHQAQSTQGSYVLPSHSIYTLAEFVRELANSTKLSYQTVSTVLAQMSAEKFALIRGNENRALTVLKDVFTWSVYALIINKVSYSLREVRVKTALTDVSGALLETLPAASCGKEPYPIANAVVCAKSLYDENFMPVDSGIERETVDESQMDSITVFAKLPKINIPTPVGKYNPDFGYALMREGSALALYLVLETKGYDSASELGRREDYKMKSAERFFEALRDEGLNVRYQKKINGESLSQVIASMG
ncbi:DEAD/DEAH box helicase family protein [Limnohabitans sp.]|uniref:restriction endonuclease n=1 Tax=Limnohabitans sp. TaxID=1907725 RepID=UPI00286F1345|nr:DEAD/DEAH box helicase family protein [Limnohabitans sp.]